MIKYPSIEQFKNVIKEVTNTTRYAGKDEDGKNIYNNDILPVLRFKGTTKVHGSNFSVQFNNLGDISYHSRERTLSLTSDNMGSYIFGTQREKLFRKIREIVQEYFGRDDIDVCIFSEFAGKGIQKGVAVSELEKSMFIFDIQVINGEDHYWLDLDKIDFNFILEEVNKNNIYFINQYKTWEIDIDFNNPESVQNQLIRWTTEVGDECPVGKAFGISGLGEGIVFAHNSEKGHYKLKIKDSRHSNSKVKTLAPVDEEMIHSVNEFANTYVTEARLEQGLSYLENELELEADIKNTGKFISWVVNDIMKEEHDSIIANNINVKKLSGAIGNIARQWFIHKI